MTKNQCEDSGSEDEQFKGLTTEQQVEHLLAVISPQLNSKESRDIARAEIERIVADQATFRDNFRNNKRILLQVELEIEQINDRIAQIDDELETLRVYEDVDGDLELIGVSEDQDGINPEVDGDEDLSGDDLTQITYETRMDTFIGSIPEGDVDTNDLVDFFKEMIGDIPAPKDSPPNRYQLMGVKHNLMARLSVLEYGLEALKMRGTRLIKAIEKAIDNIPNSSAELNSSRDSVILELPNIDQLEHMKQELENRLEHLQVEIAGAEKRDDRLVKAIEKQQMIRKEMERERDVLIAEGKRAAIRLRGDKDDPAHA